MSEDAGRLAAALPLGTMLGPGEPLPWFAATTATNPSYMVDTVAGRYVVLSFPGALDSDRGRTFRNFMFGAAQSHFDTVNAIFLGVVTDPADVAAGLAMDRAPAMRWFQDFDQKLSRHLGVDGSAATLHTLVLDPALRVVARIRMEYPEAHNAALEKVLRALPPIEGEQWASGTAPVLIVPRILELDLCRRLIAAYDAHGGEDSGFMTARGGRSVGVHDHSRKRRSDYSIEDQDLCRMLAGRITRRLVPMIQRATQFRATRIERYIVACYEAERQGFFAPHRDNTTPATRHRKFAVTMNLNAEEYDGGDLRFPEFGHRTYRAPTGGAVVFSCSMLHEALPVTRGRRYAFLPFLYDDAAAEVRERTRSLIDSPGERKPDQPA
ncbi:2OG-Fe(II) oxygenase family protein [Allostella humosa]|nr:2OG-Fe(II) oxygenase [Stella humosa]